MNLKKTTPTMTTIIFSYGSNMSHLRIQDRVPSARFLTAGYLTHHLLRWHKPSKDGSGKCDAYETSVASDVIWGGLFEIAAREKHLLDKAEGLGVGYSEKLKDVFHQTGSRQNQTLKATLYIAIPIESDAKPYEWYKEFVVSGAIQCGLPAHYISDLKGVEAVKDPDAMRNAMNNAILRGAFAK